MNRGTLRLTLIMVWVIMGLCLSQESQALVEVLPEASMTIDGRVIADRAAIAGQPALQELLAAFGRAESAVQHQDLDALLKFYAQAYNYHGLKRADVRRIWGEVFEHYTGLSSTHLFSEIKVLRSGTQLRAEVTCTGGLYGTERRDGQRITLDSWFREVHFLVHEDGAWRFLGNAGQAPSSAPVTSTPHHPLF